MRKTFVLSIIAVLVVLWPDRLVAQEFPSNKGKAVFVPALGSYVVMFDGLVRRLSDAEASVGGADGFTSATSGQVGFEFGAMVEWDSYGPLGVGIGGRYDADKIAFDDVVTGADSNAVRERLELRVATVTAPLLLNIHAAEGIDIQFGPTFTLAMKFDYRYEKDSAGTATVREGKVADARGLNIGARAALRWVAYQPLAVSLFGEYGQNWLDSGEAQERIGRLLIGLSASVML